MRVCSAGASRDVKRCKASNPARIFYLAAITDDTAMSLAVPLCGIRFAGDVEPRTPEMPKPADEGGLANIQPELGNLVGVSTTPPSPNSSASDKRFFSDGGNACPRLA
jgi:hypothetical protein